MKRTTKAETNKPQMEVNEKELIEKGVIIDDAHKEHSEPPALKIIRRTIWEDLTVSLNNFFAYHEPSIPYTSGNWIVKGISGKNEATDFVVFYDGIRCFPVTQTGRNIYTIGSRMDCDLKDYIGIGKRVVAELLHRGYIVENAVAFQRRF